MRLETTFNDKIDVKHNNTTLDLSKSFRILNTPSDFAKENLFYVQEAGYLKSLKSHISKRERLDSYLFLAVVSGNGHFTYKGVTHELESGSCLFINCNHSYSHNCSDGNPWELMWIHFNGKSIEPYLKYYEELNEDGVFHTERLSDYTTIIQTCLEHAEKKDIHAEFVLSKLVTDLLTLCITNNKEVADQSSAEKMGTVREYIDENFKSKMSLGSIAEQLYISKYYLAREFKKCYGSTIGEYISLKRITYAKELLRFTNKSVEDVSMLSGVPDTNYFAKVFRKVEGCSPSEYRVRW